MSDSSATYSVRMSATFALPYPEANPEDALGLARDTHIALVGLTMRHYDGRELRLENEHISIDRGTPTPDETATPLAGPIGARIRAWREQKGMTLTDLAEASGVSRSYLYQIERGASEPTVSKAVALARALGIALPTLLPSGLSSDAQ